MALDYFEEDSAVPPNMSGCGACCINGFECEETPYIETEQSGNYGQNIEIIEGEPTPVTYNNGSDVFTGPGTAAQYAYEEGDIDIWDAINYRWRVCVPEMGCSGILTVTTFLETDGVTITLSEDEYAVNPETTPGCGEWTTITGNSLPLPFLTTGESTVVREYVEYVWTPSD